MAWVEVAGRRFEKPTVVFAGRRRYDSLGSIGQGLLRNFTVIFNYPESRIALLPK